LSSPLIELRDTVVDWWSTFELTGLVGVAIATVILLVLLPVIRTVTRRLDNRLHQWQGTRIRALRFQRQEILASEDIVRLLSGMLRALGLAAIVLLIATYLSTVFSFFPWSRGVAIQAVDYVLTALQVVGSAILGYLPNLLVIVIIALFTRYLIRLAELIFNGIRTGRIRIRGFYPEWVAPTFNIVRFLFITIALVMIFPLLPGAASPAFRGVSIFFGVLLSLGSTGAVANVVAGVVITYTRAFQIGDRVRIADTEGDVVERTMFVTRVRTPKNVEIAIPNSMVLSNHVINYSAQAKRRGLILHTTVTIGYDVDRNTVTELLVDAARRTDLVVDDPAPFVLHTGLDDFYVRYELNACTHHADKMPAVYSELHGHILDRFHEAGVEIASPHYSAIRDGNRAAIPADYLPRDYESPPFRVHPLEKLFRRKPDDDR
jgi:small-conductance mechanosensitive channel